MQQRRLGRTGHASSVVTLGGAALAKVDATTADAAVEMAVARGVNHIDVAPSYGNTVAELNLAGPLRRHRSGVFLGCKTLERTRVAAWAELQASLHRLQTDHFDLYQLHAVNDLAELDRATARGGALEALLQARNEGLTRFLGITAHGRLAPAVELEALRRFPFETVLLPLNFILWADADYRRTFSALLQAAQAADVGIITIKAVARGPWGERSRSAATWYEPFTDAADIQRCVRFVLSQPVTTLASCSDVALWPAILDAAEQFVPMSQTEQDALVAAASGYQTIFP